MKPPLQEQRTQQTASGDGWQSAGLGNSVPGHAQLCAHSREASAGGAAGPGKGKGFSFSTV